MNRLSSIFVLFIASRMVQHSHAFSPAAVQALLGYGSRQSKIVGGTTVDKGRYEYLALTAGSYASS